MLLLVLVGEIYRLTIEYYTLVFVVCYFLYIHVHVYTSPCLNSIMCMHIIIMQLIYNILAKKKHNYYCT